MRMKRSKNVVLIPIVLLYAVTEAFIVQTPGLSVHRFAPVAADSQLRCRKTQRSRTAVQCRSLFLLDFDGTLCDSVADTTQAAFSAASMLWPDDMKAALVLDPRDAGVRKSWVGGDWSQYENDQRISEDIPRWLEEKMRQLRPVVSRGSDAVLAARLVVTDAVNSKSSTIGERPLAAGEIVENWDVLRESMLFRVKRQATELEEMFACERPDTRLPVNDWVERNPIFPSIAASIADSDAPIYVITRRDVEFTKAVLESAGITIPTEHIIFAEQGRKKVDIVHEACQEITSKCGGGKSENEASLVYVDDNINVVREAVGDLRLAGKVRVFFAEWGYSSSSQKAMAARYPRVTRINERQFSDLVKGSSASSPP